MYCVRVFKTLKHLNDSPVLPKRNVTFNAPMLQTEFSTVIRAIERQRREGTAGRNHRMKRRKRFVD